MFDTIFRLALLVLMALSLACWLVDRFGTRRAARRRPMAAPPPAHTNCRCAIVPMRPAPLPEQARTCYVEWEGKREYFFVTLRDYRCFSQPADRGNN